MYGNPPVSSGQPQAGPSQPRRSGQPCQPCRVPDNIYDNVYGRLLAVEFGSVLDQIGTPPSIRTPARENPGKVLCSYDSCLLSVDPGSSSNIGDAEGLKLIMEEGGEYLQNFLLAVAAKRTPQPSTQKSSKREIELPNPSLIREWQYWNILRFPGKLKEEWRQACIDELSALRDCQVFELMTLPDGKKVIRNRWVFDIKPDG